MNKYMMLIVIGLTVFILAYIGATQVFAQAPPYYYAPVGGVIISEEPPPPNLLLIGGVVAATFIASFTITRKLVKKHKAK